VSIIRQTGHRYRVAGFTVPAKSFNAYYNKTCNYERQ